MIGMRKQSFQARALLSVCGVLMAVVPVSTAIAPAAHAGSAYPYASSSTSSIDPWHFYKRYCTSYVAWRFNYRGVYFDNFMRGGRFSHARNWDDNARNIGFRVDRTPRAGSIAHWNAYEQGVGGYGHVAYVESVNANGSVVISEFNYRVPYGYSQRGQAGTNAVYAPRYIHIRDL